jgi:predicted nucleic acid-binding protein
MTESKALLIDTNILIYHTFEDFDKNKHHDTCRLLDYLSKNKFKIFVSTQVLREFFAISTNGNIFEKPLSTEEAVLKLEEFQKNFRVIHEDDSSIEHLKQILKKYKISKQDVHDANIAATMITHDIKQIATFNQKDFKTFKEIELFEMEK